MMNKLTFYKHISDYFEGLDAYICPKHKLVHAGKLCYVIKINLCLWQDTGNESFFDRAEKITNLIIGQLRYDLKEQQYYIYPGMDEPWNCSQNVIDIGSICDMLAFAHPFIKDAELHKRIEDTLYKLVYTYLLSATDKLILNQRLWGMTGLASAYAVLKIPAWKDALTTALEKSFADINQDGSINYHNYPEKFGISINIKDTTTYYHSRHVLFILHCAEKIGYRFSDVQKIKLKNACDFLVAITGPNGLKSLKVETKRWYWFNDYEVASHAYDIPALVRAYNLFKEPLYLEYANKMLGQWVNHQSAKGFIISHKNYQRDFQCEYFWSAQAAWAWEDFSVAASVREIAKTDFELKFADADIWRIDKNGCSMLIRGRKHPMDLMHGPATSGILFCFKDGKDITPRQKYHLNTPDFSAINLNHVKQRLFKIYMQLRGRRYLAFAHNLASLILEIFSAVFFSSPNWDTETSFSNQQLLMYDSRPSGKRTGRVVKQSIARFRVV